MGNPNADKASIPKLVAMSVIAPTNPGTATFMRPVWLTVMVTAKTCPFSVKSNVPEKVGVGREDKDQRPSNRVNLTSTSNLLPMENNASPPSSGPMDQSDEACVNRVPKTAPIKCPALSNSMWKAVKGGRAAVKPEGKAPPVKSTRLVRSNSAKLFIEVYIEVYIECRSNVN